jgi:hypothetical protein
MRTCVRIAKLDALEAAIGLSMRILDRLVLQQELQVAGSAGI